MKALCLFTLLFGMLIFNVGAQNCNLKLSGTVTDEHDGSVLAFSTVHFLNESRGVATDVNGFFSIENLCPKTYQVVISHVGCEPDTIEIRLKKSMKLDFKLEHHLEELMMVSIDESPNGEGIAKKEELSEDEFFDQGGKPIAEMLSEINGVSAFRTGANISKPVINGFKNNRVQLINNGVQLQSQQWGDEHAPEIDPFATKEYSVVKGASAVKYAGGALGGLVIAKAKALNRNAGVFGELNSLFASNNRMANASLMLEGAFKQLPSFAWRIQGSTKRSGNIRTPNYYQKNTGIKELNGSADFGFFKEQWNARVFYSQFNSEIGIFSGAHIGNITDLKNAIELGEPRPEDRSGFSYDIERPKQYIVHELTKAEINYYPKKGGKLSLKLARQFNIREEYDKELPRNADLAALDIPELSLSLETYSANLDWTVFDIKDWKTNVGIQFIDQNNSINSFTDFIPDYKQSIYSVYLLEQWEKEKLGMEVGFRMDQNQLKVNKLISRQYVDFEEEFSSFTFNAGFRYQLRDSQLLKVNLTYAERPPSINELFSEGLHHGTASLEFGSAQLTKEKSKAVNFSYELKHKKIVYELYTYLQYINDFIYLNPTGLELTIRGAFPSFQWDNTKALVRGFDQTIRYQISESVSAINKSSFIWGNNLSANNYLINMPSNRIESELNYKGLFANENSSWRMNLGHQYIFKQNRFNSDQELSEPPKGYHLFYSNLSYKTKIGNNQNLELGLRIDNILNTVYRDYLNRFRYYADEQGRNFTIKAKYNF